MEKMENKIFVGSIPSSYTIEEIIKYFSSYGEVEEFTALSKTQQRDHICGILTCISKSMVKKILEDKHELRGQILDCHIYLTGNKLKNYLDELNKRNIYVTEIPFSCTYNQLKCVFGKFGKIQNIKFLVSKKVKEKYAIVTFNEITSAEKALQKKRVKGLGSIIKVKVFKDKHTKEKTKLTKSNINYGEKLNHHYEENANRFNNSHNNNRFLYEKTKARNQEQGGEWKKKHLIDICFGRRDKCHEIFDQIQYKSPIYDNHLPANLRWN